VITRLLEATCPIGGGTHIEHGDNVVAASQPAFRAKSVQPMQLHHSLLGAFNQADR
jgi:hypothetical protein